MANNIISFFQLIFELTRRIDTILNIADDDQYNSDE